MYNSAPAKIRLKCKCIAPINVPVIGAIEIPFTFTRIAYAVALWGVGVFLAWIIMGGAVIQSIYYTVIISIRIRR
jgi:hypothetical protein